MSDELTQKGRAGFNIQLDRHEAKFIIPPALVPKIVEYIRPFCEPDHNGRGDPPEYTITTLQLDNMDYALHMAKYWEATNRFKLRVRTYGIPGENLVFLEVKQKYKGVIVKSRTSVPFDVWSEDLIRNKKLDLRFKSSKEEEGFLKFVRLTREIDARPVILIRYIRQSYFGKYDSYARVTFDRKLEYQPTTAWDSWGRGGRWLPIDGSLAQGKQNNFSGVVLELKTLSDTPRWMIDLVMNFALERCGNCKYSTAIWAESLFSGSPMAPMYADELLIM